MATETGLKLGIRAKILLSTLLTVAIVFAGSAFYSISIMRAAITSSTENLSAEIVKSSAHQIGSKLEMRVAEMNIMANSRELHSLDLQTSAEYLGKQIVNLKDVYEMFIVANSEGECFTNNGEKIAQTNIKDRAYFQQIMSGKVSFLVSDPVVSKVSQKLVAVVVVPIKVDGKVAGLMGGTITCDDLSSMVKGVKLGETGSSYIIQSDGLVIAHPNEQYIRQLNVLDKEYQIDGKKTEFPTNDSLVGAAKKFVSQESGIERYIWDGSDIYAFFNKIPSTGWTFIVTLPVSEMNETVNKLTITYVVGIILALVLILVGLLLLVTKITNPIKKMTALLKDISEGEGDLTQRILLEQKDELGDMAAYFNVFTEKVQQLIIGAKNSAQNMHSFVERLTETMNQSMDSISKLLDSVETVKLSVVEISNSIEQTSTVMEEVANGTSKVSSEAQSVLITVSDVEGLVDKGEKSSEETASQIENVKEETQVLSEVSGELKNEVSKISEIINTINRIAEQTNLLALNAAIESARAGESGRGFAVVAEEVRKLAELSKESTKNIEELLHQVVGKTMITYDSAYKVSSGIVVGKERVQSVHTQFEDIAGKMKDILIVVENTSAAMEELSASNQEVTATIESISHSAVNMRQSMEGIALEMNKEAKDFKQIDDESKILLKDSEQLKELLERFKV
jgi:Methyl-accepting chemotaxis protein